MKKIVVTGVSRGLGLALSKALLEAGYGVIGLGRGDSPAFTALEAAHPGQTAYVQADNVTDKRYASTFVIRNRATPEQPGYLQGLGRSFTAGLSYQF